MGGGSGGGGNGGRKGGGGGAQDVQQPGEVFREANNANEVTRLKGIQAGIQQEYTKTTRALKAMDAEIAKLEKEGSTGYGQKNGSLYTSLLRASENASSKASKQKIRYKNIGKRIQASAPQ